MAVVTGYAIHPSADLERGRKDSHIVLPKTVDMAVPTPHTKADFPRSASYTYLGDAKQSPYTSPSPVLTIKSPFSRQNLLTSADTLVDISPPDSSGCTTPEEPLQIQQTSRNQPDLAEELRKSPKIAEQRYSSITDDDNSSVTSYATQSNTTRPSIDSSRTTSTTASTPIAIKSKQSLGRTFSKAINRRSWYASSPSSSSRSPSPVKSDNLESRELGTDGSVVPPSVPTLKKSSLRKKVSSRSLREKITQQLSTEQSEQPGDLSRRSTILKKKPNRLSGIFKVKDETVPLSPLSAVPPMPSLPKSFSSDRLPMLRSPAGLPDRAAPMPRLFFDDRTGSSGMLMPKKKDELWSVLPQPGWRVHEIRLQICCIQSQCRTDFSNSIFTNICHTCIEQDIAAGGPGSKSAYSE